MRTAKDDEPEGRPPWGIRATIISEDGKARWGVSTIDLRKRHPLFELFDIMFGSSLKRWETMVVSDERCLVASKNNCDLLDDALEYHDWCVKLIVEGGDPELCIGNDPSQAEVEQKVWEERMRERFPDEDSGS